MRMPTTIRERLAFGPVKGKYGPKHWKTHLLRMWVEGRYDDDLQFTLEERRCLDAFRDRWSVEWLRQYWRTNNERSADTLTDRFSPLGRAEG